MLPIETAGEATSTRAASTLFGAFVGRHAELYRSRGAAANRIHAAVRLVERRGDTVRDAGGIAAFFSELAGRNAV